MTLEHIGPAANSADRGYFAGLVVAGLNEVQDANAIDITPEAVFAARNVHLANGDYPGVDRSLDKLVTPGNDGSSCSIQSVVTIAEVASREMVSEMISVHMMR